jgi:AraC-like DNA-binding protein
MIMDQTPEITTLQDWDEVKTHLVSAYDDVVPPPTTWTVSGDRLWSVWYLRRGSATVRWAGGRLQAGAGHWVMMPPDLARHQRLSPGCHLLSLRFAATWPHGRQLFAGCLPRRVSGGDFAPLMAPAEALAAVVGPERTTALGPWRSRPGGLDDRWRIEAAFARFLAVWYDRLRALGCQPTGPGPGDRRLAAALDVLVAHQGPGPVPYHRLLPATGLSRVHLDRLFGIAMGCSPREFLEGRCLAEARRLLQEESAPIKEIAARLGFADASRFGAWFRHLTGLTPATVRRHERLVP